MVFICILSLAGFYACDFSANPGGGCGGGTTGTGSVTDTDTDGGNKDDGNDIGGDDSIESSIQLNGSSIAAESADAVVSGTVVTITAAGTYNISGSLLNGQIIVDAPDTDVVRLNLNGVNIKCSNSAPIFIRNADKTIITLGDNTNNTLTDGSSYVFASGEDEPNAALFSKDDLTIKGDGSLTVTGNYNDGINSKNDLRIKGGNITVKAADDGLRGKDSIKISGGNIAVTAGDDGLKSDNEEEAERGIILIEDGNLTISSGDDAIMAHTSVQIDGGDIRITKSYEGIESTAVIINGGTIRLASSDDGINAVDKDSSGSSGGWPPAGEMFSANAYVQINGGYLAMNANGDGLDSNGSMEMTGGTVIVHGPTANNNGPMDYGAFDISGGFIVAVGSAGMAQAAGSSSSSQNALLLNFSSAQEAGTLINIQTSSGKSILTLAPQKRFQSVTFSSPELVRGTSYVVYLGGRAGGKVQDGLYLDGSYTPGNQYTTFTVSGALTKLGSTGGFRPF